MHLNLTPLDIAFLRDVDHVATAIRSRERDLRIENRILAADLEDARAALAVERRTARLLLGVVVALMLACAWVAMGVAR